MNGLVRKSQALILTLFLLALEVLLPGQAMAHCDTLYVEGVKKFV